MRIMLQIKGVSLSLGIFATISCVSSTAATKTAGPAEDAPDEAAAGRRILATIPVGRLAFSDSGIPVCAIGVLRVDAAAMTIEVERRDATLPRSHPEFGRLQTHYSGCDPKILPHTNNGYETQREIYRCEYIAPRILAKKPRDPDRSSSFSPERLDCARTDDERWKLSFGATPDRRFEGMGPSSLGTGSYGWYPDDEPRAR